VYKFQHKLCLIILNRPALSFGGFIFGGLGGFVWDGRAVAFEREVEKGASKDTARRER